ncbi:unnamed protein product [Lupinus luteus]|uniref:Hexosyltransferase n=1 Tax=Lupinus luteus TaxID=3873 RepID=A0AAV1WPF6_LUPLU
MCVFQPCIHTYHDLLRTLQVIPPTPFAEQDLLNLYFKDIYKPIPLGYNLVLAMLWRHPENEIDLHEVKVVHYCAAGSKPWRYTGKEENMQREDIKMLVKKWWDIYNDDSLSYKEQLSGTEGETQSEYIVELKCVRLHNAQIYQLITSNGFSTVCPRDR